MSKKKYFIDDRFIIPDEILKMTSEERQTEIARLEKQAQEEKQKILKNLSK